MTSNGREVYARLHPEGADKLCGYFIDIGRKRTGTRASGFYWLGFSSMSDKASQTDLGNGYSLWREGPLCAVLLKELPYAAVDFAIGRPDRARARAVVDKAEAYLRDSKVMR